MIVDKQSHFDFDYGSESKTEITDYSFSGYFRFPGININNDYFKFKNQWLNDFFELYFNSFSTEKVHGIEFFFIFSFLQNSCHAAFENQVILFFSSNGLPKTITAERMPRMTPILPYLFDMVTFSVSLNDFKIDQKYRFN